ncbi:MAG: TRM11 family methyltransferase, partial [Candidatus Bathyarchaeota archaeon]|nr:TRM11 family methyltransferase [Candidatus Bathyarchaeota archaeon]
GLTLERKIGEIILKKVKGTRVDLKIPEKTFFGVLTDDRFVFGLKKAEIKPRNFVERGPRGKVFSHSSAMPPKIARCMVNLAQPRKGSLVLDPFCGTGSFLVEAGLMGFRVLGFDVKRYMVEGTLKNLALYGIEPEGMAVADARFLPLSKGGVDCVATDPPYGISATTLGLDTREVFESFLSAAAGLIGKGGLVCLAAPKIVRVGEVGERLGFKHRESHFIYIHRNLTREIAVFQRK